MKSIFYTITGLLLFTACGSSDKFDATGTIEATEITVSAEAVGKILHFDIEEGDILKIGEYIGIIDTMQLSLSKQQIERNISSLLTTRPDIQKQIAALNAQIDKQEHELNRVNRLLKDGAATIKQRDDIEAALEVLHRNLDATLSTLSKNTESLNAQSSSLDIQIAQINDKLQKSRIVSPTNGTVLAKYMEAGEFANIGQPLFKIANLENVFLRAYFTSDQLADIQLGQEVKVIAQFGDDKERQYTGKIVHIASESEFTPKTIQTKDSRAEMVYAVKISVKNDGYLKIGTYGQVML